MAEISDVNIEIGYDQVNIRFGKTYTGKPELNPQVITELRNLQRVCPPEEYGGKLFNYAFREQASVGVGVLQDRMDELNVNFRIILDIDPAADELHQLWWECLVNPADPMQIFSMSTTTPFIRELRSQISRPLVSREKLRIMVVIANPVNLDDDPPTGWGLPEIKVDEERQIIEDALAQFSDRIEDIKFLPEKGSNERASLNKINQHLRDGKYHILHIIAHGGITNNKGFLLLERDDDGMVAPIADVTLARAVRAMTDLRLVILASCYSAQKTTTGVFTGLAPKLYQAGVPAVIAMQDLVSQVTARRFSQRFYEELLHANPEVSGKIDIAMNQARMDIYIDDISSDVAEQDAWGWAIPVLFMHGDGRLYELVRPTSVSFVQEKVSQIARPSPTMGSVSGVTYPPPTGSAGFRSGVSFRQGISQDLITQMNTAPSMQGSVLSALVSGKQVGPPSVVQRDVSTGKLPEPFLKGSF